MKKDRDIVIEAVKKSCLLISDVSDKSILNDREIARIVV